MEAEAGPDGGRRGAPGGRRRGVLVWLPRRLDRCESECDASNQLELSGQVYAMCLPPMTPLACVLEKVRPLRPVSGAVRSGSAVLLHPERQPTPTLAPT